MYDLRLSVNLVLTEYFSQNKWKKWRLGLRYFPQTFQTEERNEY